MMRGRFISIEGPDGSGKTTQVRLLHEWLVAQGYPLVVTREPGGTVIGERVRDVVHDCAHAEMAYQTEILLYSASRAQLVAQVILPALEAGQWVLCDRYCDSTYAYQGYGRGLPLDDLRRITLFATQGLLPDLTLYLDLDAETGLARRAQSGEALNRLDRETLAFHQRVRAGYLELAAAAPQRWVVINAAQSVAEVHAAMRAAMRVAMQAAISRKLVTAQAAQELC